MFKYFFFSTYYLFGWLILCTCCWTHDMFGFINLTVLRDGVSVMNNKMIEAFLQCKKKGDRYEIRVKLKKY